MSSIKITNITNRTGDSGAIVSGIATASGSFKPPSGTPEQRVGIESGSLRYNTNDRSLEFYNGTSWRTIGPTTTIAFARGVFGGGANPGATNTIDYITIASTGNATDFGDLTVARSSLAACSSSTRGVFGGGSPGPVTNTIDYITIATIGDATDFGDLTVARRDLAACSSSTRGVFGGGFTPTPVSTQLNVIDYITIASVGNAIDFGDLTVARRNISACSSSTRGVFGGGYIGSPLFANQNIIDYITIASVGNATDFGDLTVARGALAACSSSTRGVFGGGNPGVNTIDYITIASTGDATDFGDLTTGNSNLAACSSITRGVFGGGGAPGNTNAIEYITIASVGNALDFGDLTAERNSLAATSNNHGGLS